MTTPAPSSGWNFNNSYTRLPGLFFQRTAPVPVKAPRMVILNRPLAAELGIDAGQLQADVLAGNALPPGADPIAQAYAGHQFGHFTMLGDGRAILLGEQITPAGRRLDIQLKGSGPTPFSRRGDGRAALGPMLREYVISEALQALGLPTTRSLAVVATGEPVYREEPLPGAVLTRVAASHVRVGTFEYAAAQGDTDALRALADYTIRRHDPELVGRPYADFLSAVVGRQASLIARWLQIGFLHGVMNTDNMAISGESIDFGPCAFLDGYDPNTVFSSIDRHGRYAFGNQPTIAHWNLARFAETLLPLLDPDPEKSVAIAKERLEAFPEKFRDAWYAGLREKIGLATSEAGDIALLDRLLGALQRTRSDWTNTFRALADDGPAGEALFADPEWPAWRARWHDRLEREPDGPAAARLRISQSSPAVIPRNHLVEEALAAATQSGDLAPLERLLDILSRPFERPADPRWMQPPPDGGRDYQTFCGT